MSLLKKGVLRRDNVIGIAGKGDSAYILTQGNEPDGIVEYAKLLKTYYENDRQIEDSTAVIESFGIKTPPIKNDVGKPGDTSDIHAGRNVYLS